MAKVQVQVTGGSIQQVEAYNVAALKAQLNVPTYQATVNGESEDDNYELSDYEFVVLSPAVKGAAAKKKAKTSKTVKKGNK